MKKMILIGLLAGFFAPASLHAQKVYKDGDKVILDMTVGAGMPADVVTHTPKYTSFTPNEVTVNVDNRHDGSINATVFQKLEIAPHDLTGDGTIGSAGGTFTWLNAFSYCKNVNYESSSGWRLPTQRELQMMWIFKPALKGLGVEGLDADAYWCATEASNEFSWTLLFSNGNTPSDRKVNRNKARCVREIVD